MQVSDPVSDPVERTEEDEQDERAQHAGGEESRARALIGGADRSRRISASPGARRSHGLVSAMAAAGSPSPPDFEADASAGGNKFANLQRVRWALRDVPGVSVPEYLSLSHDAVQAHLEAHAPEFGALLREFDQAIRRAEGQLSEEARSVLERIRAAIGHAVGPEHPLDIAPRWLASVAGSRLMVRSTGREDSAQLENAGGNESIANVDPEPEAISVAAGQVLQSYFGEKSLLQRAKAQDAIGAAPFMPVLLQVMVGEQPGGAVPISGVMFGEETEGPTPGVVVVDATYGHNEGVVTGLVPTDTVYLMDDGTTHEVVRRKDRRMVPSPEKNGVLEERPNVDVDPAARAVPRALAARLLDVNRRLTAEYGRPMDVEWTYDREIDELSILQARPLVQRHREPPTYLDLAVLGDAPRFVASTIGSAGGRVRIATAAQDVVVAPTARDALKAFLARAERDPEPVAALIAEPAPATSHEATIFRASGVPLLQLQGGLAEVQAALARGTPVLLDPQNGLAVIASALTPEAAEGARLEEALGASRGGPLREGWIAHPVPTAVSVPDALPVEDIRRIGLFLAEILSAFPPGAAASEACAAARAALAGKSGAAEAEDVQRIKDAVGTLLGALDRVELPTFKSLGELLGQIKATCRAEDLAALVRSVFRVGARAVKDGAPPDVWRRVGWQVLSETAQLFQARDADVRTRLFAFNWLEAVLVQHTPALVDALSFRGLIGDARGRKRLSEPGSSTAHVKGSRSPGAVFAADQYALGFDALTPTALTPAVAAAWRRFTRTITRELPPAAAQCLATSVATVQRAGLGPLWLNQSFMNAWLAAESPAKAEVKTSALKALIGGRAVGAMAPERRRAAICALALADELHSPENAAAIEQARARSAVLEKWAARSEDFGDPDRFEELFGALKADLAMTPLYEGDADEDALRKSGGLGKRLVLAAARETVEVMDRAIKGLTGSTKYVDPCSKAARFAEMLEPYTALMETWVRRAPPVRTGSETSAYDLLEAMAKLRSELAGEVATDATLAAEALRPSDGFSVSAAMFGSGTLYERHAAETLEDLFTLTHQNALAALSMIEEETALAADRLPQAVRQVSSAIRQTELPGGNGTPSVMSVDYQYPDLTIDFNAPLRNHSARVRLSTVVGNAREAPAIDVRVEAFGENFDRNQRLERVGLSGLAWGAAAGMEIAPGGTPVVQDKVVSFTWQLRPDSPRFAQQLERIPQAIAEALRMTFDRRSPREVVRSALRGTDVGLEDLLAASDRMIEAFPSFRSQIIDEIHDLIPLNEIPSLIAMGRGISQEQIGALWRKWLDGGHGLDAIPEEHRTERLLTNARLGPNDWLRVPAALLPRLAVTRSDGMLGFAQAALARRLLPEFERTLASLGRDHGWTAQFRFDRGAWILAQLIARTTNPQSAGALARAALVMHPELKFDLPWNLYPELLEDPEMSAAARRNLVRQSYAHNDFRVLEENWTIGDPMLLEYLIGLDPARLPPELGREVEAEEEQLARVRAGQPLEDVPPAYRTRRVQIAALTPDVRGNYGTLGQTVLELTQLGLGKAPGAPANLRVSFDQGTGLFTVHDSRSIRDADAEGVMRAIRLGGWDPAPAGRSPDGDLLFRLQISMYGRSFRR